MWSWSGASTFFPICCQIEVFSSLVACHFIKGRKRSLAVLSFTFSVLPQVRQLAIDFDLPTAKRPDSQGLCFLGEISLSSFFQHHLGESQGAVLHFPSCFQVGVHAGLWNYTIGQKKGITPCIDVKRLRKGEQHVCRYLGQPRSQSHFKSQEGYRHYDLSQKHSALSQQEQRKGERGEALEAGYLDEDVNTNGGSQDSSVHTPQQQNGKRDSPPTPTSTPGGQEQGHSGASKVPKERERTEEGRKEKEENEGEKITHREERQKTPGVTVGVSLQPQVITKSHENDESQDRREKEKETKKENAC